MKSIRLLVLVSLLAAPLFAQSGASNAMQHDAPAPSAKATPTPAQQSFAILKTLSGSWEGSVSMTPAMNGVEMANLDVRLRVASHGNSIVHEMHESGKPDDPAKYDHPVTMLYLDEGQLMLTHYCDAGNRPRMKARVSPDGKTVEFDFVDVSGPLDRGNMYHALFTVIDENHHVEEWTYRMPGDKMMKARMDLQRKPAGTAASGK